MPSQATLDPHVTGERPPVGAAHSPRHLRPNELDILSTPRTAALSRFIDTLKKAEPHDVIKITCMDWREGNRGAYLLTSAGAIVHQHMLEDLSLVLAGKKVLLLQGHSDCAKSKAECPRMEGESDKRYAQRIDEWSMLRLWRNAGRLLDVPAVAQAVESGELRFCVAFNDIRSNMVRYLEKETQDLLRSRRLHKAA